MSQVTIDITKENYQIKIVMNGKTHIKKAEKTNIGSRVTEGNFEDNPEVPDELFYALESFFCHSVMGALNEIDNN